MYNSLICQENTPLRISTKYIPYKWMKEAEMMLNWLYRGNRWCVLDIFYKTGRESRYSSNGDIIWPSSGSLSQPNTEHLTSSWLACWKFWLPKSEGKCQNSSLKWQSQYASILYFYKKERKCIWLCVGCILILILKTSIGTQEELVTLAASGKEGWWLGNRYSRDTFNFFFFFYFRNFEVCNSIAYSKDKLK